MKLARRIAVLASLSLFVLITSTSIPAQQQTTPPPAGKNNCGTVNCADERKDGETDEQFVYKTRKKAIGPFKRQLWDLPPDAAEEIGANLRAKFGLLFDELRIGGTRELVERFVTAVPLARPLPAAFGGGAEVAVTAGAAVFEDDGSGE